MKLRVTAVIAAITLILSLQVAAQQVHQTIRGTIRDQDSQIPLLGATVIVTGSNPAIGAVTDADGNFRIENVPVGRVSLKVTFIGYEDRTIPNLLITSAKEEVLSITLTESVNALEEIVIQAEDIKGEVLNEMALVSAHTFSVEETQRHAGSFDDPARLAVSFAGVTGNPEGDNDIIVRGNSPKGILWRLEGIAIPNPNHFAGEGTTGGPINALSSKMLTNSDFFTGAFAPEYGDVTSGVFDMRLKTGNNEQREYTASLSTLGIDMTAEGPFKKGHRASYIANYRYSALDLLDNAGIVDFGGVPRYQDVSFKLQWPVNERHNFSAFGLGGKSGIDTEDKSEENEDITVGRFGGRFKLGVVGLSHNFQINEDMYLKTTFGATTTGNVYQYAIPDENDAFYNIEKGSITRTSLMATTTYNYKLNARHKVETGLIFTQQYYDMESDEWDFDREALMNEFQEDGRASTLQAFGSWKYRLNDDVTMIGGLHFLHFNLNNNTSIEPRLALKWQYNEKQSFNAGVGLHSKLETVSTYLGKQYAEDGTVTRNNMNLGISKAAHFVLGYDNQLAANTHLKVETYYQHLFNVPVENSDTSAFSMLNVSGGYTTRDLVNDGTGKNYGVEFTLERYLYRGLYYMGTASLFRSLYTPKDGVERKSAFDNNYVVNFIGGKEFKVGRPEKNRVLFLNTRLVLIGGKRYAPIDLQASIEQGTTVIDESNPFSTKGDDIFRTDFSIGLRRNKKRTTTELKFDVQNILNNQTVVGEGYVHATQSIYKATQLGMLPTISYKISF